MPNSDLTTIGGFARVSGLTASALRFYADSGLLVPALVDPASGYRYYADEQLGRATAIRELREIGMPLDTIARVLDADADTAARIVDDHVAGMEQRLRRARERATEVKATLSDRDSRTVTTVSGPVFAAVVEQILAATGSGTDHPVLGGVHLEISAEALTLTATDRFRLSTRTLVPELPIPGDWAGTLDGADLRRAVPEIRRHHRIGLIAGPRALLLRPGSDPVLSCRILADPFPDHRLLLGRLAAARTRVVIPREALLRHLESQWAQHVQLRIGTGMVTLSDADARTGTPVAATVTGPDITLGFDLTTLYPAVSTAIGPDVMIDIADPAQPVVIRSADDGDLTTLAMPVAIPPVRSTVRVAISPICGRPSARRVMPSTAARSHIIWPISNPIPPRRWSGTSAPWTPPRP